MFITTHRFTSLDFVNMMIFGEQSWSSCHLCCRRGSLFETGWGFRRIAIRLRSALLLYLPRTAPETGPAGTRSPF